MILSGVFGGNFRKLHFRKSCRLLRLFFSPFGAVLSVNTEMNRIKSKILDEFLQTPDPRIDQQAGRRSIVIPFVAIIIIVMV